MKLPCAAVRDLLPLFAENMTEPETRTLIEEHLRECPECQKKYAELEPDAAPAAAAAAPIRTLKKEIRRRRWYAALIAGLIVFVAIVAYFHHAGSVKPIPWQDGLAEAIGVRTADPASAGQAGEEGLALRISGRISAARTEMTEEEDGTVTAILQGFGRDASLDQNITYQDGELLICPVPDRLIYGYESPQKLLWGKPLNGGVEVLPRLALTYYLLMAAAAAALLGLLWLILRHQPWRWILRQAFFLPVSYIAAHLLLMGLRTTSFFFLQDFTHILLTACALYALLSLLWQVWLRRREAV